MDLRLLLLLQQQKICAVHLSKEKEFIDCFHIIKEVTFFVSTKRI
jgi:hypothetical protein